MGLFCDYELDGFQGIEAHSIVGPLAADGQRARIVRDGFIDEPALMQIESFAVSLVLFAVFVGGDSKAAS